MPARQISYLRCAAYLRPLPRTHQQQKRLLAQTHSRGRARRNIHNENFPTILFCSSFHFALYNDKQEFIHKSVPDVNTH